MTRSLIFLCAMLSLGAFADGVAPGVLEGHLRIVALKSVELAEGNAPAVTAATYAQYPLAILSHARKKEIAQVTADASGDYRVSLPPGDYILDVQNRAQKHVRIQPKEFNVKSSQTARVDLEIDTGIR